MHAQFPLVALLASVALAANPDKPAVNPAIDENKLGQHLENVWKAPKSEINHWLTNGIAEGCRDVAVSRKLNPADFRTFSVKYSDCDQPWVFCRHKDSSFTEAEMIERFGEIPVKSRSFVRHFIAAPTHNGFTGGITWSTGDIIMAGTKGHSILTHEVGHSMDWHALGYTFSASSTWQNAYAKDQSTITAYGRTSWMENFADSIMVAYYNQNIDGGIGTIHSKWREYRNQKETAQNYFTAFLSPGGKCGKRMANTNKVPFSGSAKMAALTPIKDKDTEVTWSGIEVIVPRPELEGLSTEDHEH